MIASIEIGLAHPRDAASIATLSRDAIEYGLRWRWTPERVRRTMSNQSTNVVVAREAGAVIGFALMEYKDDDAHLLLLAVMPSHRRRRVATTLHAWLEETFRVAGISMVRADVRELNLEARAFYRSLGFDEVGVTRNYYQGVENAVHLVKKLGA